MSSSSSLSSSSSDSSSSSSWSSSSSSSHSSSSLSSSSSSSESSSSSSDSSSSSREYSSYSSSSESSLSSSSSSLDFPMTTYVTNAEIVDFMQKINPDFAESDIDTVMVGSSFEYINNRMDTVYDKVKETHYIDGRGEKFIYSPHIPIVGLDQVTIIYQSQENVDLVLSGTSQNCWFDPQTGRIWTTLDEDNTIEFNGSGTIFPDRVRSVMIKGYFGTYPTDLIKHIQLLIILKSYQLLNPSKYKTNITEETIGRYKWKASAGINTADPKLQSKNLDAYIEHLFDQLPSENKWGYEAI